MLSRRSSIALAGWLVAYFFVGTPPAAAVDLDSVISSLYGGDGITLPAGFHTAHFTADGGSIGPLIDLNTSLSQNLLEPSLSSALGSFEFDASRAVFVPTVSGYGNIVAERAETVGAGKFTVGASYTRLDFKRFEGDDLNDLSVDLIHEDTPPPGLGNPAYELDVIRLDIDVDLAQDILALFGTYGITDRLDVGVAIPFVHTRIRARSIATIIDNGGGGAHAFGAGADPSIDSTGFESATGIGDIVLRGKYRLAVASGNVPDLAFSTRVKLATGDSKDLLGSGETSFRGTMIASKNLGRVTPQVNLGYEFDTKGDEKYALIYAGGMDISTSETSAVGIGLSGRYEPTGDGIGDSLFDLGLGAKFSPLPRLVLNLGFVVPLNRNEGLRTDFAWTTAFEYNFF